MTIEEIKASLRECKEGIDRAHKEKNRWRGWDVLTSACDDDLQEEREKQVRLRNALEKAIFEKHQMAFPFI